MVRPLHIRGAHIWDGKETAVRDLYTDGDRIIAAPVNGAQIIDLEGYTIFPGLINAHDHLELNHYPRSKFRERYDNARQWHEDMNVRLNEEPYKSLRAYPLWDKLFIGGLKNLLCGATTVAHHNPPHKDLWRKDFPVRVLKNYGWSHSFYLSSDEEIVRSYQSTLEDWPWFIHLAEGTDDVAASEYQRLKELGCTNTKNTILIHGVGINTNDSEQFIHEVSGIVVCPTTNKYLLGHYSTNHDLLDAPTWTYGFMALGSDSRLTATGDLLDEMQFATQFVFDGDWLGMPGIWHSSSAYCVTRMVTLDAAEVLNTFNVGELNDTYLADWIAIRAPKEHQWDEDEKALCNSNRADLALVVKGGIPQIGDPDLMAKFTDIKTVDATLDGKPKAIHIELTKRIHANALKEKGLEVESLPKRKLFQFI